MYFKDNSQALNRDGIWKDIIHAKYLKNRSITKWIRDGTIGKKFGSFIWSSFHKVKNWFLLRLQWPFSNGNCILIGFENILGVPNSVGLPIEIIDRLHTRGLFYLAQVIQQWQGHFLFGRGLLRLCCLDTKSRSGIITSWNL